MNKDSGDRIEDEFHNIVYTFGLSDGLRQWAMVTMPVSIHDNFSRLKKTSHIIFLTKQASYP